MVDMVNASEKRSLRNLEHRQCPFCGKAPTSSRFIGHVSRHLEELSLSAIPQDADSDSDLDSADSSTAEHEPLKGPLASSENASKGSMFPVFNEIIAATEITYWSAVEHIEFMILVEQCGSDWKAISQALGTKTRFMVSALF
jgi:formate dehydrogenase maturation protein FdhE